MFPLLHPSLPASSGRQQGQMGDHSGRPQGVCDTQLGTQAGPSGGHSIVSALPRVWKELGKVFLPPSEITMSQELVIFLLSVHGHAPV